MTEIDSTIETIRLYETDIQQNESKIRAINERLKEEIESMDAAEDVENAKEALAEAQDRLKQALLNNPDYQNLLEDKAEINQVLRDQKEILSDHLVAYFAETKERQIELNHANGDARAVIVTGKLGKPQKYQTSIFSPLDDMAKKHDVTVEIGAAGEQTSLVIDKDGMHGA